MPKQTAFLRPMLYGYWSSSCTWRVRNALQLKGIDYDVMNVSTPEIRSEKFRQLSPFNMVPVFVHGKTVLTQSLAIMEFLDDEYVGTRKLFPGDPYDRAQIRSISLDIVSAIQPLQSRQLQDELTARGLDPHDWVRHFIQNGFVALEHRLKQTSGLYSVGDNVSAADCCLVPQVYNAVHKYGLDMGEFPTIVQIDAALHRLPAFQRAHPLHQTDAPAEIKVDSPPREFRTSMGGIVAN